MKNFIILFILFIFLLDCYSQSTRPYPEKRNINFFGWVLFKGDILSDTNGSSRMGTDAGKINVGSGNIFIGQNSGIINTVGSANTFIGYYSGFKNIIGSSNVALGQSSFMFGTGGWNTAIGSSSLEATSGAFNTAIGCNTLKNGSSFERSTALGYSAGANSNSSRSIFIGYQAGSSVLGSDSLIIDNHDNRATPFIGGNMSTHKLTFNAELKVSKVIHDTIILGGDTLISGSVSLDSLSNINISNNVNPLNTVYLKYLALNTTLTTINGSTGTAIWCMPFRGTSYKKFLVYLTNYTQAGGDVITFPIAFINQPFVYGDATAITISTTTTTTCTLATGVGKTGIIIIEGY